MTKPKIPQVCNCVILTEPFMTTVLCIPQGQCRIKLLLALLRNFAEDMARMLKQMQARDDVMHQNNNCDAIACNQDAHFPPSMMCMSSIVEHHINTVRSYVFQRCILISDASRRCVHLQVGAVLHLCVYHEGKVFSQSNFDKIHALQLMLLLYECIDHDTRLLLHCYR
jgi:hypothetical protein